MSENTSKILKALGNGLLLTFLESIAFFLFVIYGFDSDWFKTTFAENLFFFVFWPVALCINYAFNYYLFRSDQKKFLYSFLGTVWICIIFVFWLIGIIIGLN
jgi:hypothetical protein